MSGYYGISIFQAFSIHDFKSVFVPSQDTMILIFFKRFQFMIINRGRVFHLRIISYLFFSGVFNS